VVSSAVAFWKAKHVERTGSEEDWVQSISIGPAEGMSIIPLSFPFFSSNFSRTPQKNVEMAIFWNNHGRITPAVAEAHIFELLSLSPPVTLPTPFISTPTPARSGNGSDSGDADVSTPVHTRAALDTPDEHALRALLLGIMHRTTGHPSEARAFLRDAHTRHAMIPSSGSTWIGGVALFELAVLELREAQRLENEDVDTLLRASENGSENEKGSVRSGSSSSSLSDGEAGERAVSVYGTTASGGNGEKQNGARGTVDLRVHVGAALGLGETTGARWVKVLKEAGGLLDAALGLSGSEVDLSSRLESRIAMTRDEIALKRDMLGRR
jgi:hypothetical protein